MSEHAWRMGASLSWAASKEPALEVSPKTSSPPGLPSNSGLCSRLDTAHVAGCHPTETHTAALAPRLNRPGIQALREIDEQFYVILQIQWRDGTH